MIRKLFLLCVIFVSSVCVADPWISSVKVVQLYPSSEGYIFIINDGALPELSTCSDGKRFSIALTHPNYDAMVSTLIFAFASAKTINLNLVSNQAPTCSPTIGRFSVNY